LARRAHRRSVHGSGAAATAYLRRLRVRGTPGDRVGRPRYRAGCTGGAHRYRFRTRRARIARCRRYSGGTGMNSTAPNPVSDEERLRRWRLVLGGAADPALGELTGADDAAVDKALGAVYDTNR